MSDRPGQLESQILALKESVHGLEDRIATLESLLASPSAPATESAHRQVAPAPEAPRAVVTSEARKAVPGPLPEAEPEEDTERTLGQMFEAVGANIGAGLIGGILLVLAGGYLLRALTEEGILPGFLGVACGLAYALVWAVLSYLLGTRGRRGAASASGLAACLVALPLIWERTVRFDVLQPVTSAVLLVALGAIFLPIAKRYRLGPMSGAAILGIGSLALILMFGTYDSHRPEPFALVLILLGIVSLAFGPRHGGPLPWAGYLFANLGAIFLIGWSTGEKAFALPVPAVAILAVYFMASIGIIISQSIRAGGVGAHQTIQGTLATLLGFGGALVVAGDRLPVVAQVLAGTALALGAAGYAFLLFAIHWSRENRWDFLLFSSLALALVAMGALAMFSQPVWPVAGLAVVLAVVGVRLNRASPGFHAAMAILCATAAGELGGAIIRTLAGPVSAWQAGLSPSATATLAAAILCSLLPLKVRSPFWPEWMPRLGRTIVLLVAILGIDAVFVQLIAPIWAGAPDHFDPGALAALRTGVLAASVVVLAALSRLESFRSARRLVWPLLIAIAIKMIAGDFPHGRTLTLAVALLLYGCALILATRLLRSPRQVLAEA